MRQVKVLLIIFIAMNITQAQEACYWVKISTGSTFTVGLRSDGTLWQWGRLGNVNLGTIPTRVGNASDWKDVDAGGLHVLALKQDGTLWGWGDNHWGQLLERRENRGFQANPILLDNTRFWVKIAAGMAHCLAIDSLGNLFSWGYDQYGQCGRNTSAGSLAYRFHLNPSGVRIPELDGHNPNYKFIDVCAGGFHTIAIIDNGKPYAWGRSDDGQIGTDIFQEVNWTPKAVHAVNRAKKISAGLFHSHIIDEDGRLWSIGRNNFRQLGLNSNNQSLKIPHQVVTQNTWKEVSAGSYYSTAIDASGKLYVWGSNADSSLGSTSPSPINIPTEVLLSSTISSVHAAKYYILSASYSASNLPLAGNFTIALDTQKTNFCITGLNSNGQLGNGDTTRVQQFQCSTRTGCNSPPLITCRTNIQKVVGSTLTIHEALENNNFPSVYFLINGQQFQQVNLTMAGNFQYTVVGVDNWGLTNSCTVSVTVSQNNDPVVICRTDTLIITAGSNIQAQNLVHNNTMGLEVLCRLDDSEQWRPSINIQQAGIYIIRVRIRMPSGTFSFCDAYVQIIEDEDPDVQRIFCKTSSIPLPIGTVLMSVDFLSNPGAIVSGDVIRLFVNGNLVNSVAWNCNNQQVFNVQVEIIQVGGFTNTCELNVLPEQLNTNINLVESILDDIRVNCAKPFRYYYIDFPDSESIIVSYPDIASIVKQPFGTGTLIRVVPGGTPSILMVQITSNGCAINRSVTVPAQATMQPLPISFNWYQMTSQRNETRWLVRLTGLLSGSRIRWGIMEVPSSLRSFISEFGPDAFIFRNETRSDENEILFADVSSSEDTTCFVRYFNVFSDRNIIFDYNSRSYEGVNPGNEIKLNIFPNPGDSNIFINYGGDSHQTLIFRISDLKGREIYSKVFTNDSIVQWSEYYIDEVSLSPGVYIIRIDDVLNRTVKHVKYVKL